MPSPFNLYDMDDKLTVKIQAYLNDEPKQRNVIEGATMLLSLNRNRIFFQNVVRKPEKFAEKVAYELRKHLTIRLERKTASDVVVMNKVVIPAAMVTIAAGAPVISTDNDLPQEGTVVRGKRADHDELPDEIKSLWDESSSLWFKIKELFEQLKGMESAPACDRFEYLKQLDECDKKYRANMAAYDAYKPGEQLGGDGANGGQPKDETDPAEIAKKVNAARKYLSENKKKLTDLKASDEKKYITLLEKVQERYVYLINTGNSVDADQVAELVALGLKTE